MARKSIPRTRPRLDVATGMEKEAVAGTLPILVEAKFAWVEDRSAADIGVLGRSKEIGDNDNIITLAASVQPRERHAIRAEQGSHARSHRALPMAGSG
jgi:hypothetical protein